MFSSALKSFSSNITSNYTISPTPSATSGPWKIHDAKKKSTAKEVSVFIFDRKSLETNSGGLQRSSASSLKRSVDEVVERLKKEASSLARLRHPSVLELVEPVEDTRNGLQFVTEAVTASLAGLLQEKDDEERAGGIGGRTSRYVKETVDGGRRRREVEIDELEIQKGLLQVSKALEFLHENAGLVHGNLTPDAVFVNAKSDWKIGGLSFLSPADNSNKLTSITPISMSEVLNHDPRLPRSVQLNLDFSSPDFVIDSNLNTFADMFSLGLMIISLYNSPHESPIHANSSITTYKRLFSSSSTVPSAQNNFLSSRPLPKDLVSSVLPRLITRKPAQRMTAKEFQESAYFDNILVSTIRFLDALPAKTPNEKAQFMRGLIRVIPSFPKSVLEKKVLPALLEEMKDRDLLSLILQNVFKIVQLLPSGKRAFADKILPRLREIFLTPILPPTKGQAPERDPAKEAGLMVLLDNLAIVAENTSGKEFKDDILPIINLAIESSTHTIVDSVLRKLPVILPVLDFTTIKNELFPVIAAVFSKTSSLGIKVRGLEAFVILCGGSNEVTPNDDDDGLAGFSNTKIEKKAASGALDKFTMQEKIIPLIRAIKTKEPAVMLASLKVLKQVGTVADADFIAMEILPVLWSMSLGPLLDLKQFKSFMELIQSLSHRVEQEHTKKLQELSGSAAQTNPKDNFMSFGTITGFESSTSQSENPEIDFESLVLGKVSNGTAATSASNNVWDSLPTNPTKPTSQPATFSWSTPNSSSLAIPTSSSSHPQQTVSRTVTPDLSQFGALTPSSTQFSKPLQPQIFSSPLASPPTQTHTQPQVSSPINWNMPTQNAWASQPAASYSTGPMMNTPNSFSNPSFSQRPAINASPSFSLPPPPTSTHFNTVHNTFQTPQQTTTTQSFGNPINQGVQPTPAKKGLDAYESLL